MKVLIFAYIKDYISFNTIFCFQFPETFDDTVSIIHILLIHIIIHIISSKNKVIKR